MTDHYQPGFTRLIACEGAVEVAVNAGADGLKREAHRFARHSGEPLESQDVMRADHIRDLLGKACRISDFGPGDDEAFEIIMVVIVVMVVVIIVVVIMVVVMVVHLVPGLHITFGAHALTQEHIDRQRAHGGFDHLHAIAAVGFEFANKRPGLVVFQKGRIC